MAFKECQSFEVYLKEVRFKLLENPPTKKTQQQKTQPNKPKTTTTKTKKAPTKQTEKLNQQTKKNPKPIQKEKSLGLGMLV